MSDELAPPDRYVLALREHDDALRSLEQTRADQENVARLVLEAEARVNRAVAELLNARADFDCHIRDELAKGQTPATVESLNRAVQSAVANIVNANELDPA